jgi:hypothetical protein
LSVAEAYIGDLEAALQGFRENNVIHIVQRTDADTGENIVYVRFENPVPAQLRQTASSILANLREALDDAMGEAAVQLGRTSAKGVYFPVCKDSTDFKGEIKRKCRKVDSALIDHCRTLEPYKHGKGELIWAMSALAGVGKHQRVLPLTITIESILIPRGSNLLPIKPTTHPNAEGEIAIAFGVSEADVKIGITDKIVVNSEVAGLSFQGNAEIRDFLKISRGIVLGIKAETERILCARP